MSLTSLGAALNRIEVMSALMPTLLPDPVDAHARAARQALDADRLRRQSEREVLREVHDLVDFDALARAELVGRDDGPGVVLGDLALDAELGALGGDAAARVRQHLPVDDPGLLALLEQRDLRHRVAGDRDRQALLGFGLLPGRSRRRLRTRCGGGRSRGSAGGGRGRVPGADADHRLADRELAGSRDLADDRRRVVLGERDRVEGDLGPARLLEVLGHHGAAQALLGPAVAVARPADREPPQNPREADPEAQEHVLERDLRRQRHRQEDERQREEHGARRSQPRPERVTERAAHDAARVGLLAVEAPPAQRERQQHREREDEQADAGGLRRGVRKVTPPEAPPAQEQHERGDTPRGQPEQRVEGGRERRAEPTDPVVGRGGLSARGPREDVGIARIVRKQRENGEDSGEHQQNADGLVGEPALPEGSFAQSTFIIGPSCGKRKPPEARAATRRGSS
jgi:hypothetical protein